MQYDIIRKYTDVPITTNTDDFYFGDTLDLYKLFDRLDVAGIDVYTGDPVKVGFYSDFMRSVKPEVPKFGSWSSRIIRTMLRPCSG